MIKPAFDGRPAAAAYAQAFRRFRALPGFDHAAVLRAEAASILKMWAGRTKVATQQDASFRARTRATKRAFGFTDIKRNPYGITINSGRRSGFPGEVWFRTRNKRYQQAGIVGNTGQFTPAWIHFSKKNWEGIRAGTAAYGVELQKLLPLAQKSVGLARQSIIQIADELGIDLAQVAGQGVSPAGIAKARAAIASNGRAYRNGSGTQAGDEVRYYVQLVSRLPYGRRIGMDRGLAGVLAGRAKYIETSYAKGAFDTMKKISAAFPNFIRFQAAPGLS